MRAKRWHLGRTLNCDSCGPVLKTQLGYFVHWQLHVSTKVKGPEILKDDIS